MTSHGTPLPPLCRPSLEKGDTWQRNEGMNECVKEGMRLFARIRLIDWSGLLYRSKRRLWCSVPHDNRIIGPPLLGVPSRLFTFSPWEPDAARYFLLTCSLSPPTLLWQLWEEFRDPCIAEAAKREAVLFPVFSQRSSRWFCCSFRPSGGHGQACVSRAGRRWPRS